VAGFALARATGARFTAPFAGAAAFFADALDAAFFAAGAGFAEATLAVAGAAAGLAAGAATGAGAGVRAAATITGLSTGRSTGFTVGLLTVVAVEADDLAGT
jgi:hypothetical protein